MGGGQKVHLQNLTYEQFSKDLNAVSSLIWFEDHANFELLDTSKVGKDIEYEIHQYFTSRGIKLTSEGPIGGGAGGRGIEDLNDIFSQFMTVMNLFALFMSLWGYFISQVNNFHKKSIQNQTPIISVFIRSNTNGDIRNVETDQLSTLLSKSLINNILISRSMIAELKKKYSFIKFNLHCSIELTGIHSSLSAYISEDRTNKDLNHMLKMINDYTIRKNLHVNLSYAKWNLLVRKDTKINPEKSETKTKSPFYFIISTKVLSDYFR